MNIVCIKHGSKYSSEYVNKLHSMLLKHAPSHFTLYCMTEDPKDISDSVSIIPFKDDSLEKWWCKMWALDHFIEGDTILLDLDVIIHGDLSRLFDWPTSRLNVLHAYWKNPKFGEEPGNTLFNSSVMKWKDDQGKKISDVFFKNSQYYMLKYKGVDRFLWNEDVEVDTLPNDIAYSYINNGSYMSHKWPLCIFNESLKQHELSDEWISQYWN